MRKTNSNCSSGVVYRTWKKWGLAAGLFCGLWNLWTSPLRAAENPLPRWNVLFIAIDDLNHWVGYTGRNPQARTPNIDRLARRGIAFTNAHCAAPACNPSRAALLSGMRPFTTGCYHNGDDWQPRIPQGRGLSQRFREAGYRAVGAGKIYHGDTYYRGEWDAYFNLPIPAHGAGVDKMEGFHEPLRHDLQDTDLGDWHAVNFCIEQLQRPPDKPWFLACGLHKPHLPFAVPRKYYELFPLTEIALPPYLESDLDDVPPAGRRMARPHADHAKFQQSGRWKAAIQSYLAAMAYTDMNVGRLLDALEASPYRDNTIIVLWGDHGWHLGEKQHWRKFALWEEATRAPLIWHIPGLTPAGARCDAPVDFMTIYPTLCDLVGLPIPAHVEGTSMRPLLENPAADWSGHALCTHGAGNHAIRTARWRYIRYRNGDEELYDHDADPYEWRNVASDPQYAREKSKLVRLMPAVADDTDSTQVAGERQ